MLQIIELNGDDDDDHRSYLSQAPPFPLLKIKDPWWTRVITTFDLWPKKHVRCGIFSFKIYLGDFGDARAFPCPQPRQASINLT